MTPPTDATGRCAAALARRPALAGALLAALGAIAAVGWLQRAPPSPWSGGAAFAAANDTRESFDLDHLAGWVAVFGPTDGDGADALRALERDVEALDWVEDLVTPFDVPGLGSATLAEAAEHPVAGRALVSPGGLVLPVFWERGASGPGGSGRAPRPGDRHARETWVEVLERTAREALAGAGAPPGWEVGVTGPWPILEAQGRAFTAERFTFTLVGAALAFLIAACAFRDPRAVVLSGAGPLVGVVVSIGVARLLDLGAVGFTGVVLPLLVLTIGFTDSLHLVIAAARERQGDAETDGEAAARAVGELAWPCGLTSLTTAIGFSSLALTSNAVVVQFGLSCALATLITFVCVIVVTPLVARTPLGRALAHVRPPDLGGVRLADRAERGIARVLDLTLRAPRVTALIAVVATIGLAGVARGLHADKRAMGDLAEGSAAARTLARIDAELGGAFPLHVRLDWDEGVAPGRVLAAARGASEALDAEPLLGAALGPAELIDALPRPEGDIATGLEDALAWGALGALPARWRDPFVDAAARRALVHARMPDAGTAALLPVFARVRARLAELEAPGLELRLVGEQVAHLETLDEVTLDLARSLALAAALILVVLGLAFRSWRLGLASVVPSLLPLGASAAGLALLGGRADLSTLTALTLSLGIAADDTIHVLARWRAARAAGLDPRAAARLAVLRTLPALALTTLTLTAAFGVLLASSLPTIREFGLLAAVTLVAAFLADVWLLPALLVVLCREGGSPGSRSRSCHPLPGARSARDARGARAGEGVARSAPGTR